MPWPSHCKKACPRKLFLWFLNSPIHSSYKRESRFFFILTQRHFLSLLLGRGEGRKEGRETLMGERSTDWLPPGWAQSGDHSCLALRWNLQPKYVPWLGIEPATFQLWEDTLTNWATPARAEQNDFFILAFVINLTMVTHLFIYFTHEYSQHHLLNHKKYVSNVYLPTNLMVWVINLIYDILKYSESTGRR